MIATATYSTDPGAMWAAFICLAVLLYALIRINNGRKS